MAQPDSWMQVGAEGAVLRPWHPAPPSPARRLVACSSVRCSDVSRWLENASTWAPHVDAVVVVLGGWSAPESAAEMAAATAAIHQVFRGRAQVVPAPVGGWTDQCHKRSAYFAVLSPGDVAFVVDADERVVAGASALAAARHATYDVGWITVSNPTRYARAYKQPRLFILPPGGLTYRGRHHWIWTGDRLVATHQYGGAGYVHDVCPVTLLNDAPARRTPQWRMQHAAESAVGSRLVDSWHGTIEPLRILQLTRSDDGLVAYRLHSAINACTPHFSAFASGKHPFRGPTQLRWPDARQLVGHLLATADVVHCHSDYTLLDALSVPRGVSVVIHHHGTRYRKAPLEWAAVDRRATVRLCSNLDLLAREPHHGPQWLPNPVPVGVYLRWAAAVPRPTGGLLRVAHSPSQPERKGTSALLEAQALLKTRGVEIEVELLTGMAHADVLQRKAACDVTFDSFWLGIQCSGLEGAAMGQPVIAGDPVVAGRYTDRLGAVPYTYANDVSTLANVLERMATDPAWRAAEAQRVGDYVLQHHDEAQVAARYIEILHTSTGCWGWKHNREPNANAVGASRFPLEARLAKQAARHRRNILLAAEAARKRGTPR